MRAIPLQTFVPIILLLLLLLLYSHLVGCLIRTISTLCCNEKKFLDKFVEWKLLICDLKREIFIAKLPPK